MTIEQEYYSTHDTALVAWLYINGYEPSIDNSQFPTLFSFPDSNPELSRLIQSYNSAEATGNIVAFFRAYKQMIRRTKRDKSQ